MNPKRRLLTLVVVAATSFATLVGSPAAVLANPPPGTGTDYDLSTLGLKDATFTPAPDTITTDGSKAKAILPAMGAALPDGRYIEVDLTAEAAGATVMITWWSGGGFFTSGAQSATGGVQETLLFDLSGMGASDGTVKIRVDGTPGGGSAIHRITLFDVELPPPNIVFILVDDLSAEEMDLGFYRSVPGVSALETEIIDKGTTLENFFFATPLCCPSRASFLTGQYPHNHLVWLNNAKFAEDDNGGMFRFMEQNRADTSLGVWMQDAGYKTALVGKYLNGYPNRQGTKRLGATEEYVPNGWDEWYGSFLHDKPKWAPFAWKYTNFRFNENGIVVEYPDNTPGPGYDYYMTDIEGDYAVDFIDRNAGGPDPFFLYLNIYSPHGPTVPRADHDGIHTTHGVAPPTPPSCNEADLSDKPAHVQAIDGETNYGSCWGGGWQRKLDMTLSVDEVIGRVIAELTEEGVIDDTYIFFASDNGLLRGHHQIGGKSAPYEESIRVPIIARGPGIPEGVTRPHLVSNIDVAPTLLDIAEGTPNAESPPIDGESLLDILEGSVQPSEWRDALLVELRTESSSPNQSLVIPKYFGVRTQDHLYVEYESGDTELYDLNADPYQLDSIHATADPGLIASLAAFIADLDDCIGAECAAGSRSGPAATTSHVHDILVIPKTSNGRGIVKVFVHDASHALLENALVTGKWWLDGDLITEASATTPANGKVKFSFAIESPTPGMELRFCVTDIAHVDADYEPGDNEETCQSAFWP